MVLGVQPQTSTKIAVHKSVGGINPDAYKFAKERQELFEYAQDNLRKVGKRMKKYANLK